MTWRRKGPDIQMSQEAIYEPARPLTDGDVARSLQGAPIRPVVDGSEITPTIDPMSAVAKQESADPALSGGIAGARLLSIWPLVVIVVGLLMSATWTLGLLWALLLGLRWLLE